MSKEKMTNFEYFKDEILEITRHNKNIAIVNDTPMCCGTAQCKDCLRYGDDRCCNSALFEWLYADHIEKPKLTKKERMFCELVETGWIARDENGLGWYFTSLTDDNNKPFKRIDKWECCNMVPSTYSKLDVLTNNLFSFITWDDEEPWSVEDLLKLEACDE